jgi:hypothetical protein
MFTIYYSQKDTIEQLKKLTFGQCLKTTTLDYSASILYSKYDWFWLKNFFFMISYC